MLKLWNGEPALILGLVQSGLALGLAFGVHLSGEQIGAIMAFSAAALSLIVRAKVSPNPQPAPPAGGV